MKYHIILFLLILLFHTSYLSSQTCHLKLHIHNQSNFPIVLGSINGDQFTPIDSLISNDGHIKFKLSDNNTFLIYRVVIGQTLMAKVLNEPPQQLDFIFNGKDIEIETDFNATLDSVNVISSEENLVWFDFLKKEKIYQKQLKELVMQINYFQNKTDDVYYTNSKQTEIITQYNKLQKEKEALIISIQKEHPKLYATKLIRLKREPFLDGNTSEKQRRIVQKTHFFDGVDFSDESLINSSAYTDIVFQYFMLYAQKGLSREKQEEEFKKAIDVFL
ncbi:hypothetical protein [Carboxylicivirga sp. N1Y90]|uniref:hypothetical protein n=1 Tax=Carboxylicivirga fragile TaxID=3417571 RepID=UPI003D325118|nr:hypothetical protein [Marinilabiliaceae bacterium N1Y90]